MSQQSSSSIAESKGKKDMMMWRINALCCLFALLVTIDSFTIEDVALKSAKEFVLEWNNGTITDRRSFQHSIFDLRNRYPVNQTLASIQGLIEFAEGNIAASIAVFGKVCEVDEYQDTIHIERLAEALATSNKYGAVDSLIELLQKRNYSSYASNIPLMQRLLNEFHSTKGEEESYMHLLRLVRSLPTTYPFWVLYADAHLTRYFGLPRASNQPTVRHISWDASELHLLYYGLTLFPRCPELLYLRALHSVAENDLRCATIFAQRAAVTSHMQFGIFKNVYYTDLLTWLDERTDLMPTDMVHLNHTCMPYLLHHNVEDYQRTYDAIRVAAMSDLPSYKDPTTSSVDSAALVDDVFVRSIHVYDAYLVPEDGGPNVHTTRYLPSLQVGCSSHTECARPGFFVADAAPSITTHFVTQAYDLSMVQSSSMGLVYSSHTLEHLSHQNPPPSCATFPVSSLDGDRSCYPELNLALSEWRRVLAPNGKILISVPDLTALAKYFIDPEASKMAKLQIRTVLYGGQVDQYDFHKNGFYWEYLRDLLIYHKFCDIERVQTFDLFRDASFTYELVSLSVKARAC